MTTPSGTISLNDVNVELGFSGTTLIAMNQSNVRTLAGVGGSGTPISMNDLRGKSNRVTANIYIGSNTTNYTLNTAKVTGYSAGKTDVTLTINSGIYVYSTSTGSYALTVDTSWTTGDTVTIVNNGTILGKGGGGGQGARNQGGYHAGVPGSPGGPALYVQRATSINNVNRIAGGGGGGGGGGWGYVSYGKTSYSGSAGGGGGGIGNGASGPNNPSYPPAGQAGQAGTLTAAGSGGAGGPECGGGGPGGSYGSGGSSGGAGSNFGPGQGGGGGGAGGAVVGNSNITWIATGTRNGSIS